jgi:hypothetical protein
MKIFQVHPVIHHFDLLRRDSVVTEDLLSPPPGIGDDFPQPRGLEEPLLQVEQGLMEGVQSVGFSLPPGVQLSPLNQPFPVAPVPGPVNILVKGSFKTMDHVEVLLLKESAGGAGKGQGFQEGRTGNHWNPMEDRSPPPFPGLIRLMGLPPVGKNMYFVALSAKPFHKLAQVALRPPIGGIGFSDKSDFHEKYGLYIFLFPCTPGKISD